MSVSEALCALSLIISPTNHFYHKSLCMPILNAYNIFENTSEQYAYILNGINLVHRWICLNSIL
ncbi:hypothetical protein BTH160X_60402 [Brochothrix thermosphacta]|nr:hypothetical protein BTH160X_60402 [Brochothrix thermosphacta]